MLQNTTNMNGGMWQTGSVADVSCWLLSSFPFFCLYSY
jgi:hypothetical protein